jgi:hypothetical protein
LIFFKNNGSKEKNAQMKRCLLFFLALVVAIVLAINTDSPREVDLQARTAVTSADKEGEKGTQPREWATLEARQDQKAQSRKP